MAYCPPLQRYSPVFGSHSICTMAQWPGCPAVDAGTPQIRSVRAPMFPMVPHTPPSFHIIWMLP